MPAPSQVPAKERALRLLSVRARSREELRTRLLRAGFHPAEIEAALRDLETVGLVDDEHFARELASYGRRHRGLGRRGIVASLRRAGVDPELAERATADLGDDEEARAVELATRRASRFGSLDPASARRRLFAFLVRRGYDSEVARSAVQRVLGEDGE